MFETNVIVDWFSFTLKAYPEYFDPDGIFPEYATMAAIAGLGTLWDEIVGDEKDWEAAKSRPPYTTAIHRKRMFFLYAGSSQAHVLIEISGKGCEYLRNEGLLLEVIAEGRHRATRIDIAHDFKTNIRPMQVHDDGFSTKFKSITTISSPTGETFYLGSPKSEKRVRVYVYNKPHPRAGLLRFEYVFRKKSAKMIASRLEYESLEDVVNSCISTYGWKSKFLSVRRTNVLPNVRDTREHTKTLRWILTQVAPAMRRLITEQVIDDPRGFFETNFMP